MLVYGGHSVKLYRPPIFNRNVSVIEKKANVGHTLFDIRISNAQQMFTRSHGVNAVPLSYDSLLYSM